MILAAVTVAARHSHLSFPFSTLHAVGNWLFKYTGSQGSGPWYGFHSGFGANFGEYVLLPGILLTLWHMNCHDKGCWRFLTHKVEGTPFKACRKHHPVLSQHPPRITAAIMAAAHAEHEARHHAQTALLTEIHRHVTAAAPDAGLFDPPASPPE